MPKNTENGASGKSNILISKIIFEISIFDIEMQFLISEN